MSAKRGATVPISSTPASVGATLHVVRVSGRTPTLSSRLQIGSPRLRHGKLIRCLGKAPLLRDCNERGKVVKVLARN